MRATLLYGPVTCGWRTWPTRNCGTNRHGGAGAALGGVAPARAYIEELLPDVLDGTIQPGRVFDRTIRLEEVPDGYRAMADREALKVLIRP
jgi:hypothetical protein